MASLAADSGSATSSTYQSMTSGILAVCPRHGVGERYISGTDANPFRRFLRCPRRKVDACNFFRWLDDELPPHYLASVQRLKQQKESLESQLRCNNLLSEVLGEKLKLKEEELTRLRNGGVSANMNETAAKKTNAVGFLSVIATGALLILALVLLNYVG